MQKQMTPDQLHAGAALPELTKTLTQEKIDRYARAGGDNNPLHTDPAFAAKTRFGGTIAHGMLVLAYMSEMLTAAFGEAWLSRGRMKARFRAPARPGDAVTAGGRIQSVEHGLVRCQAECRNQDGEVLISAEVDVRL
jgi:3-hydroxybutyryl-CoA dehydratase